MHEDSLCLESTRESNFFFTLRAMGLPLSSSIVLIVNKVLCHTGMGLQFEKHLVMELGKVNENACCHIQLIYSLALISSP